MAHLLDSPRPLLIAHRGDAVHAPENTLAAFRLALEADADILETDLWLTKDDVLLCHHDRTLDRTTDSTGAIPEMTLAQVKQARVLRSYCGQFDQAQYPDERIPSLEELLAFVPGDKGLALELKHPRLAEPERARQLVEMIRPRLEAHTVMLVPFTRTCCGPRDRLRRRCGLARSASLTPIQRLAEMASAPRGRRCRRTLAIWRSPARTGCGRARWTPARRRGWSGTWNWAWMQC